MTDFKTSGPKPKALGQDRSSLAEPGFAAIGQSIEINGLILKSLFNSTLADSGDQPIGELTAMTLHELPFGGVALNGVTRAGEVVLLEVHSQNSPGFNDRFHLNTERSFDYYSPALFLNEPIKREFRVIALAILNFVLRPDAKNFHQVAELTSREEPREKLSSPYTFHFLQLPKFKEIKPDFNNPLHCWLTALVRSEESNRRLMEVVEEDANLLKFSQADQGFAQFVVHETWPLSSSERTH
ncbi:MAG: Rpn family recombination-promoting nuclease/putative transposase [Deltaproteobacteria bacterium]|jgi:hypothetical protein|nr:Rpn family recombination-promoting nuclease/putative transposase [Deltaproteobacteria bacterium]